MTPRPTQPVRRPRTETARPATTSAQPGAAPGRTASTPARTPATPRPAGSEPVGKRPAEPVGKRAAEPVGKRAAAPVAKRVTQRVTKRVTEPVAERVADPAAAPVGKRAAGRPAASPRAPGRTATPGSPSRTSASGAGRPTAPRRRTGAASETAEVPSVLPAVLPGSTSAPTSASIPLASRTRALQARYLDRVSNGSVGRFAARARRRRWTAWRPLAVGLGLLALVVVVGWVVGFSPLLGAREVQLVGADRVTRAEVEALVAPEIGRPLSRLDAAAVRSRVEALPEVESAQVLRVWPSTVEVRVTERVPVAAVPDPGGFSLVDAAGVQVELVAEPPGGLPVVSAETVEAGDDALLAAARVLESLPAELSDQVTGTTAGTPDSVTLTLASGATVVWGSPEESDRKADVLQVLLATPAEVYDVSAPGTPVTR